MNKLLTIVIPVYNVEKFIRNCLDSLVIRPDLMEQLEVLVVNDGTPDNSALIAKEYEKKYPCAFKVIDKENGGHGSAFNMGLAKATGKYIRFLDSDDWFDKENFEKHLDYLQETDVDLIINPLMYYHENSGKCNQLPIKSIDFGKVYDTATFDFTIAGNRPNLTIFHNCSYKTALFKPYLPLFAEGCFYDDVVLWLAPIVLSKNFVVFDYPIYYYRVDRPGQSISKEKIITHISDHTKVNESCVRFLRKVKPQSTLNESYIRKILSGMISFQMENISRSKYAKAKQMFNDYKRVLSLGKGLYDKRTRQKVFECLPFIIAFSLYRLYDYIKFRDKILS